MLIIAVYSRFVKILRNVVGDLRRIDVCTDSSSIVSDVYECSDPLKVDRLSKIIDTIPTNSLIIVLNLLADIHRFASLFKDFADRYFVKSVVPIDSGIAVFVKQGFDKKFLMKTVDVWRKSVVEGPYPIHYNTARFIYSITKFVASRNPGWVIEVGTGNGFSTLWIAQAAYEVGQKVLSIDNRCDRVEYARRVLEELGLDNVVLVCADAKSYSYEEVDRVSMLFIDGKKDEYLRYVKALESKLGRTLLLAHNTISDAYEMRDFLEYVCSRGMCINIATDPAGLLIASI